MSTDDANGPVRITQRDIYDKLVLMDEKLTRVVDKADSHDREIADHEVRMRTLESFKAQAKGVAALATLVVLPTLGYVMVRVLS